MLSNLVLSVTYQCPAECRYCGAECSPRQKERLSLEEIKEIIDHVYSYGELRLVVFTGGEPFLIGRDLLKAVEYAAEKGIFTRIVTNAYWAKTEAIARKIMRTYKEAGLGEINLSCDDYHQEFIPLERIKNANNACLVEEIPCLIGHKIMKDHVLTIERIEQELGIKLTLFDSKNENPSNNLISTGYTVPVAQNMHLIPDEDILYPKNNQQWKQTCTSILQRVIITPRKELSICCGMIPRTVGEVVFGKLGEKSLEQLITEAHEQLFPNWLALEGPYGIMRFIQRKRPDIEFRAQYVNICHLCSEIFTRPDCRAVLHEHAHEYALPVSMERSLYDHVRQQEGMFPNTRNADCVPAAMV